MQAVGLFILIAGAWIAYCGVYGIDPLKMMLAIIQSPSEASDLILEAREQAAEQLRAEVVEAGVPAPDAAGGSGSDTPLAGGLKVLFRQFTWGDGFLGRGGKHKGVDIQMPVGTPLPALAGGVVSFATLSPSAGYTTTITTPKGYKIMYMHCSRYNESVRGKTVKGGAIVAYSGGKRGAEGAGNSTGPHLHVGIYKPDGTYMDPVAFNPKDA